MAKKILITGAGGFIGGFIVTEALNRGFETWAAVRATTSREYLSDPNTNVIELDFSNAENLKRQLSEAVEKNGKWDYIIHNLGATKCTNFRDFNRINFQYLRTFVDTLHEIDAVPESFLMMSSLSAMGMGDDKDYTPFKTGQIPKPNTKYGVSKMKAEMYLQTVPDFPYVIFRATGVYGPHEKDYYLMLKSIKNGFDFSVGYKRQMLTFIYVKDLVAAMMDALSAGVNRKIYYIAEDRGYTQDEFRQIAAEEMGKKFVVPIKCPLWITYLVCSVAELWGIIRLKPSTLNRDKFTIIKQRNWLCDVSEAKKDFNFNPQYDLRKGLREAIGWYRKEGWL